MTKDQPAFPMSGDPDYDFDRGMTLRQYYAAKAMQGMMADHKTSNNAMLIAKDAFKMADAMIKFEDDESKQK